MSHVINIGIISKGIISNVILFVEALQRALKLNTLLLSVALMNVMAPTNFVYFSLLKVRFTKSINLVVSEVDKFSVFPLLFPHF